METEKNLRQQQKDLARRRILDSARRLFSEQGFDETTVRQVAQSAQLSAASVIGHFATKNDLLIEILFDIKGEQLAAVGTIPKSDDVVQDVAAFLQVIGEFDLRNRSLVVAFWCYSWRWNADVHARVQLRLAQSDSVIKGMLQSAINRGDLNCCVSLDTLIEMLFALYGSALRRTIISEGNVGCLMAALTPQLDAMFCGLVSAKTAPGAPECATKTQAH